MSYAGLATFLLIVHFAFLAYVVLGGFLAWRWPRAALVHLPAAAWGLAVVAIPLTCPLTSAEHWARRQAGQATSGRGFIDRYIEGVLYPEQYTLTLQILVGVLVIGSWAGAYVLKRRRDTTRNGRETSHPAATV